MHRIVADLRASGLFDEDWYREQVGDDLAGDPIAHYVSHLPGDTLSPQPLFMPHWYRAQPGVPTTLDTEAFIHYVRRGAARGVSPHPLFDAKAHLLEHPEAASTPGGPLGHYLGGAQPGSVPPLSAAARDIARTILATNGWEHLPRTEASFDIAASDDQMDELDRSWTAAGRPSPLVSIVIPTRDRREGVLDALRSVLAQTYQNWQVLVVDDGSEDGTYEAITEQVGDPRVSVIRRDRAGGVSAARNAGLARCAGDYVAYLDSDNTWSPRFLERMVAAVTTTGARFAYAVSALREDKPRGRTGFRSLPFHREALQERNYIDCIVVLHDRALLDEVGTFDEDLRRNVDWDLFIRMSQVTDFIQVPFVATEYDAWEQRTDRITLSEPFGYRYIILAKHRLDWRAAEALLPDRRSGVSLVLHAHARSEHVLDTVGRLLECSGPDTEVVVVDAKLPEATAVLLQARAAAEPRLRVLRQSILLSSELARGIGSLASSGRVIVFCTDDTRAEPGWLQPLVAALDDPEVVAVQPLVLCPDGTVWSAGVSFARGAVAHQLLTGLPGDAPEVVSAGQRQALSARVLAVRATDLVRVRGFDPLLVDDLDSADLSLRLAALTGGELRYVPASWVSLHNCPTAPAGRTAVSRAVENRTIFEQKYRGEVVASAVADWGRSGYDIAGYEAASVDLGYAPVIVAQRPARPLRWAIKIGAPTVARRVQWGDWHFAIALKESLIRLGHEVVIDCRDAWYRPTSRFDDVTVVLRGVSSYATNPQHVNVMWAISHPEAITAREAAEYDYVFAASTGLAHRKSRAWGREVIPLLQATDARRFRPVAPDARYQHDVLFVGNARGVRPSVATALQAGIVPSVYGVRWAGLLPEGAWQGEYIGNELLPAVYGAAGVVLNDHWDDMRRDGLLSNRLFDLAACGARVVSDHVDGISEVFGPTVRTYTSVAEFEAAVTAHLSETDAEAAERMDLAERVRREHSFDARAQVLHEAVQALTGHLAGSREVGHQPDRARA